MGKQLISGAVGQTRQPEEKISDAFGLAILVILGAMKKNISSPDGATGLIMLNLGDITVVF